MCQHFFIHIERIENYYLYKNTFFDIKIYITENVNYLTYLHKIYQRSENELSF